MCLWQALRKSFSNRHRLKIDTSACQDFDFGKASNLAAVQPLEGDILAFDFESAIASAYRGFVFWDTHGFDVVSVVRVFGDMERFRQAFRFRNNSRQSKNSKATMAIFRKGSFGHINLRRSA
jgi:hypothetical protein